MRSSPINGLAARVEELGALCTRLTQDNAELRTRLDAMCGRGDRRDRPVPLPTQDGPGISRRGVLGKALGAAAAGVAGVVLLEPGSPAAADDGNSVTAGADTKAEHSTSITYDGFSSFGGVVLLANDSAHLPTDTAYPAALGGWAGRGQSAGYGAIANGIYGYTEAGTGHAVVGRNEPKDTGFGGAGVYGENLSTSIEASAVFGRIPSTSPGTGSAGVRGENRGIGPGGIGVYGSQNGSGSGVYGTTPFGAGVFGQGWTGVRGTGEVRGIEATGLGRHAIAVEATVNSTKTAIRALNGHDGPAVHAASTHGRGGIFSGAKAQVQLTAGARGTHPVGGTRGDLYVDNTGRLWFCKKSGAHGTWKQIA
jgi:hypothetical protein